MIVPLRENWYFSIAHLLLTIFCLFGVNNAVSAISDYRFYESALSDSLTQRSVNESFQDSNGYLWFLTQDGINRYDGYRIEQYTSLQSTESSRGGKWATGISEDSEGNIWVSTLGNGLTRYDRNTNSFVAHSITPPSQIAPIANPLGRDVTSVYHENGFLWLGTASGIALLEISTNNLQFIPTPTGGQSAYRWFTRDNEGSLLVATNNSGILVYDEELKIFVPSQLNQLIQTFIEDNSSNIAIRKVRPKTNNELWIATDNHGLFLWNSATDEITQFRGQGSSDPSLPSDHIRDVFTDSQDQSWVATDRGLVKFNNQEQTFSVINIESSSTADSQVLSIYQSFDGIYWVGTFSGLVVGQRILFKAIKTSDGLIGNAVNAIGELPDGSIIAGTEGGLSIFNKNLDFVKAIDVSTIDSPIRGETIMSLLAANDEEIWVGTFNGGLLLLNPSTNEFTRYSIDAEEPTKQIFAQGVPTIISLHSGNFLVATFGGGLTLIDRTYQVIENFVHDPFDERTVRDNRIVALSEIEPGKILIGTEQGLDIFYEFEKTFSRIEKAYTANFDTRGQLVWAMASDSDGNVWLASQGEGLQRWAAIDRFNGHFTIDNISDRIQFPSRNIYAIQPDDSGFIWLSHSRGLTRYNHSESSIRNYGQSDGLQSPEFNHGSSAKLSDGQIVFGGVGGFSIVDSDDGAQKRASPKITITDIRVLGRSLGNQQEIIRKNSLALSSRDYLVSFEFAVMDFSNPLENTFAYKLDGLDKEWIEIGTSRQATFTNLPSGIYTLLAKGTTWDGIQTPDSTIVRFKVNAPPWKSSWAYTTYFLLALVIIWLVFSSIRRKAIVAEQRQAELETLVRERTADLVQARELAEAANEAKSAFLATMTHELRTPLHGLLGNTELLLRTSLSNKQKAFAETALSSGNGLLRIINSILDFSKSESMHIKPSKETFNVIDIIDSSIESQSSIISKKSIQLIYRISPDFDYFISSDVNLVSQIISNILSNAVKFTDQGSICISLDSDREHVNLTVSDTGIGISNDSIQKIFHPFVQADSSTTRRYGGTGLGLSIVEKNCKLIGGSVSVESVEGHGTKFCILLPIGSPACAIYVSESYEMENIRAQEIAGIHINSYVSNFALRESLFSIARFLGYKDIFQFNENNISETTNKILIDIFDLSFIEAAGERFRSLTGSNASICIVLTDPDRDLPEVISWENIYSLETPLTLKAVRNLFENIISTFHGPESARLGQRKPTQSGGNFKVLVAEDVETNQTIAREMLGAIGCFVSIAGNGKEAIEMASLERFDLIFMDCQMPIMDGSSAVRFMRSDNCKVGYLNSVPIVALTAGTSHDDIGSLRNNGFTDYLPKPFTITDLSTCLAKHLVNQDYSEESPVMIPSKIANSSQNIFNKQALNIDKLKIIEDLERATGKSIVSEVIAGFVRQSQSTISDLRICNDAELLRKMMHAIRSSAANVGADKILFFAEANEILSKDKGYKVEFKAISTELELLLTEFIMAVEAHNQCEPTAS